MFIPGPYTTPEPTICAWCDAPLEGGRVIVVAQDGYCSEHCLESHDEHLAQLLAAALAGPAAQGGVR